MMLADMSLDREDADELCRRREQDIRIARFNLLCSNLLWVLIGAFFASLVLFLALKDQLPLSTRLPCVSIIMLITLTRAMLLYYWNRHPANRENVGRRVQVATVMAFLSGSLFGVFAYLGISEEYPLTSLLVVMMLTGMVASATASISHILPMYVLFIFPAMLPAAYRLSGFEQPGYHWISALIFLYLAVCLGTSRSIRASVMHSINMRFENLSLLENLRREKQRTEIALRRAEQANRAKSNFLAAASHDLRQPLHSLRLFTATLELQTRDTQHKTLVAKIDSSVKSLEDLFNALLDISKLDAGTFTVDKQHIYLDSLLSQIEREFKPLAEENQLSFDVEMADHVIFADALLLERLIRNLASNAIQYTRHGGVTVTTRADDERVWMSVSDTGVGIPEADHARIFEEFVQLGNIERDRNRGIGLGLSIVKRLSVLLEAKVEVISMPGQGTTFTVGVPLGDPAQCRCAPGITMAVDEQLDSLFVLVIDDEEEACQAVEGLLETWGCIVMTATGGDAALQQLGEIGEVPDVVLTDYRLRNGETGGDVIRELRSFLQFDVPAIILTGDIASERLKDMQSLGFPMLHKPCEPESLRRLLAKAATRPVCSAEPLSLTGGSVSLETFQA